MTLVVLFALLMSCLMGMVAMNAAGDTEPNDELAQAESITTGKSYSGSLSASDTDDYYKVNIAAGEIIDISFIPSSSTKMYLWFGNPSGTKIGEINSFSGIEVTFTHYLSYESTAGDYYIRIYYAEGDYSFQVDVHDQNDAGSGGDAPSEMINSLEIDDGTEYSGELMDEDSQDYYKVYVDSGKIIEITFKATSATNMYCWIGDQDGNKAFEFYSKGGIEDIENYYTAYESEAGFWYVRIYYADGTYTFTADLTDQDDGGSGMDVPETMVDAYEVNANEEYNGVIYDLDNVDYYKMWVKKGATVGISFSAVSDSSMYLRVEDAEGNKVYELNSKGGIQDITPTVSERPSGYWFVKVYYADGAYAFELSADGGSDEVTDDDDVTNLITITITIIDIEINVDCDVEVDVTEVDIDDLDDHFDENNSEQLRVQGLIELNIYFEISPKNSAEEATDVQISLDIEEKIPEGTKTSKIRMFWLDEDKGEWVKVEGSSYDPDTGLLTGEVDHLTVFAAYAEEDSEDMDKDAPGYELVIAIFGCLLLLCILSKRRK